MHTTTARHQARRCAYAVIVLYLVIAPRLALAMGEPFDGAVLGLFVLEGLVAVLAVGLLRWAYRRQAANGHASRLAAFLHGAEILRRRPHATDDLPVEALTRREREVARLLAFGLSNDEIAEALYVSRNTVKTHLKHIYGKLAVGTRTEAVARCIGLRLLDGGAADNELQVRMIGGEERLTPERPAA